jgi:hypothetical protein
LSFYRTPKIDQTAADPETDLIEMPDGVRLGRRLRRSAVPLDLVQTDLDAGALVILDVVDARSMSQRPAGPGGTSA